VGEKTVTLQAKIWHAKTILHYYSFYLPHHDFIVRRAAVARAQLSVADRWKDRLMSWEVDSKEMFGTENRATPRSYQSNSDGKP
jgi:hypothetical protein